ncbi:hypothetical protein Hanom_Chr02g00129551 [Helianthus anomalus]
MRFEMGICIKMEALRFLSCSVFKREYGYEVCDMMVQSRDPVNSVGRVTKMIADDDGDEDDAVGFVDKQGYFGH